MSEEFRNALPTGTLIDTYRIESVLGEGGFGITYLVREMNLEKLFAMKELLPDGIAMRRTGDTSYVEAKSSSSEDDFAATRKYFISEARVLAKMNHPAVVSVQRLMEANGTCYMVMDYVEGDTLGDYLKKHGGTFSSKSEFEKIFYPLMSGLEMLHAQGIIHRDIKPGNIMVKPDGSPVLLDFGAATQVQSKTMTITQMLSAGYSPFEQYTSRAKQGPYTDIYALGATMLKCITGEKPDDASDRVYGDRYQFLIENEDYMSVYGTHLLMAVDAALQMDAQLRPQTVGEWRQVMEMEEGDASTAAIETGPTDDPDARPDPVSAEPVVMPTVQMAPAPQVKGETKLTDSRHQSQRGLITIGGQEVAFRWCPPSGEEGFMMGSPTTEKDRDPENEEHHKVILTKGFWIGETEVTQGLWQAVMGQNPSRFKEEESYPVETVSWTDCQKFISELNANGSLSEGVKAALPTEAQWEYACRAGSKTAFHYGDSIGSHEANFNGNYPYGGVSKGNYRKSTVSVKSYEANAWGLYDMHGNVWEWCSDFYDKEYYGTASAGRDPTGAKDGQNRVLRGGGWGNRARRCRSAYRGRSRPDLRDLNFGFRLSLQVEARSER
jgi:formylglycine-generating enzyme required for sulfatase activity